MRAIIKNKWAPAYYCYMTLSLSAASPASRLWAWSRGRSGTSAILLIAGVATLLTSFASLPAPLLGLATAGWTGLVVFFARAAVGARGLTALCILIKSATIALIVVVILNPASPVGPTNGLDWIPLGALNAGSGLWFLALIRHQAR
jgi:hypothetical protein